MRGGTAEAGSTGRKVAAPDGTDLSGTDQAVQGGERLANRDARIGEVQLVEIDAVGVEAAQARIARELRMKRTPHLTFEYDPSVEHGVKISRLIDEVAPDDDDHDD